MMCGLQVTLVVSPLLALIEDQINHLRARSIRCEALNSATGVKEGARIFKDLNMKRPMTKLLYLTPEKVGFCGRVLWPCAVTVL